MIQDHFNRALVHAHSWLQYGECARQDVQLTHDFLKSLSEFFASSWLSIFSWYEVLRNGSRAKFTHLGLTGSWLGLEASSGSLLFCKRGSDTRFLFLWWHVLGSKVFYKFLFIFIEVGFPAHDNWVLTTGCEVITTRREANRIWGVLVTVQGVKDMTLPQIPNLDGAILGGGG